MLNNKERLTHAFLAVVILFTSWIMFYSIPRNLQYPFFFLPAIVIVFYKYFSIERSKVIKIFLFGIVLFRYSIPPEFLFFDLSFFATLIRSALMISFFLIDEKGLRLIYNYFKKYLAMIIILGLPFFLLYIAGLLPFGSLGNHISGGGRRWNIYLFFSLQVHPFHGEILRFPAIFDEPGYLGTILAFVLAIEQFRLRKRANLLFLFAGLLTFSLAFYSLIGLYFLLSINVRMKHKVRAAFLFLVLLIGIKFFLPHVFQDRIVDRLYFGNSLTIYEDRRVGIEKQNEIIYELSKLKFDQLFWGIGYKGYEHFGSETNVNWSWIIFQLGIVFTVIFISLILYYSKDNYQTFLFAMIFILSIVQRPAIFDPIWFFLLVYGITISEEKNRHGIIATTGKPAIVGHTNF